VREPISQDDLALARDHLAKAESKLLTEDGLHHLQEGLALVEAVLEGKPSKQTESVAVKLGRTYTTRIYDHIRGKVEKRQNLSEPELEHLFAVIRVFDDASFELPPESKNLKVDIVRRLVDLYYEGYTPAQKEAALRKLAELSGDRSGT
jgi:hypothetical protein